MKKLTCNLLVELSGQDYDNLLDYALSECRYFLLVTDRENKQLSQRGKGILEELTRHLYRMEMKSEWPGTILHGGKVPIYVYHLVQESAAILKSAATRLYEWQRPDLPDDLCLLRQDESPWLTTIAHENDSYFELYEDEIIRLLKALPTYASLLEIVNKG